MATRASILVTPLLPGFLRILGSALVMWKNDNRSTPLLDVVWKGVPPGDVEE
jgi:hypothetical protein